MSESVDYKKIRVRHAEAMTTVTLNNPARKNAIGIQMVWELLHALAESSKREATRVVVLTGEGEAFCAGGDFSQMTSAETDGASVPQNGDYSELLHAMLNFEKPIIARIVGPAMGGGLGLAACATFALAEPSATLGTPEINVGLFPMMIMAVLSRIVPRRKLMEMMLLGQKMSAEEALGVGLLSRVVPRDRLDDEVRALGETLASKSPVALRLGMRAFRKQDDMAIEAALPMLRDALAEVLATDDAREGLMAFLEKRKPVWTGK
jgi:enoyl-CoA hydratase/carnithine racemase